MNTIFSLKCFFLISVILLFSCGKDNTGSSDPNNPTMSPMEEEDGYLRAMIDGAEFSDYASAAGGSIDEFQTSLTLIGLATNDLGHERSIEINLYLPVGEDPMVTSYSNDLCYPFLNMDEICCHMLYGVDNGPNTFFYFIDSSTPQSILTINSIEFSDEGWVSGTFQGKLLDEEQGAFLEITQGEFLLQIEF